MLPQTSLTIENTAHKYDRQVSLGLGTVAALTRIKKQQWTYGCRSVTYKTKPCENRLTFQTGGAENGNDSAPSYKYIWNVGVRSMTPHQNWSRSENHPVSGC